MTEVYDYVKMKLISQLNQGIPRVLEKLLKHFNGAAILSFIIPSSLVLL